MMSKCANPSCATPFHYLRDGRLFRMEIPSAELPITVRSGEFGEKKPARRVEHFWLCGPCSAAFTLNVQQGQVVTVPVHAMWRAAAS
jgi:hypothetical protein